MGTKEHKGNKRSSGLGKFWILTRSSAQGITFANYAVIMEKLAKGVRKISLRILEVYYMMQTIITMFENLILKYKRVLKFCDDWRYLLILRIL